MKSPNEIVKKIGELVAAEEELQQKIEEALTAPKMTDAVVATVAFYQTQRKYLSAKIEILKWLIE